MIPIEITRRVTGTTKRDPNKDHINTSSRQLKNYNLDSDINSMQRAMSSVLAVALCFGLCPVHGIRSQRAEDLRFSWKSLRVLYSLCVIMLMLIPIGFSISWYFVVGFAFNTIGALVYYVTGMSCCLLLLHLAPKWPELLLLWQKTELSQKHYGYPKNLRRNIITLSSIIFIIVPVEFLLWNANCFVLASYCSSGSMDLVRKYFVINNRHFFEVVNYNHLLAFLAVIINTLGAFCWSYANLFVMLISIALASRFRLLNNHLRRVKGKVMSESFWREAREDYNALSHLTSNVNAKISALILLCFATNLFYVCQQLLNSMTNFRDALQLIYTYVSFGYLLLRTIGMLLYASSVYEEGKFAKEVLYAVPSHSYQTEVHRFLIQVTTDDVALTAFDFFPVTRTVLLTLAGTVVTFEVVLVQFNTSTYPEVSNTTELCVNLTQEI